MRVSLKSSLALAVAILILAALALGLFWRPAPEALVVPAAPTPAAPAVPPPAVPEHLAADVALAPKLGSALRQGEVGINARWSEGLPASLRGTEVPGGFQVDAEGHLIPTLEVRTVFDYFLSAVGEEPMEQILSRLRGYLADSLAEPARGEAMQALASYVEYKVALANLESELPPMDPTQMANLSMDSLGERLQRLRDTRREHMGEALSEAFFADEEAYDRYTLERLRLDREASLSPEDRAARLTNIEATLPEHLRQARQETRQFEQYQAELDTLKSKGGDAASIQALREQTFGPEAAARLAELDRQRADWDRRWQNYAKERDALARSGMAAVDLERARQALREKLFTEEERMRVDVLDGLANSP